MVKNCDYLSYLFQPNNGATVQRVEKAHTKRILNNAVLFVIGLADRPGIKEKEEN